MAQVDNRIVIQLRLGKEPEIKEFGGGRYVAHTTGAYTGRRRQGEEWVDGPTSWFRITAWDKTALILSKLPKGAGVMVDGRIEIEGWETEAGEKRETINITADRISIPLYSADAVDTSDNGITVSQGRGRKAAPKGSRHQEEPF